MLWKSLTSIIVYAGIACLAAGEPLPVLNDPYGICSHVSRTGIWDWPFAQRNFSRMNDAGISWVRTDWDWYTVEPEKGKWNFEQFDRLAELAQRKGINILPILASPAWAGAEVKSGRYDSWRNYVRTVVGRYGRQFRYWEVWNEPNYTAFLTPGGKYVPLLKASYEEIKKTDPSVQVLHAAACGIDLKYIEESFKAGSGNCFDVMNLHPYNWNTTPERMLLPDLDKLKALMEKYKLSDKPIWITETGWSTFPVASDFWLKQLPAALSHLGIDPEKSAIALVSDPDEGVNGFAVNSAEAHFPYFGSSKKITLRQIRELDVKRYPVLVPAVRWEFPSQYMPDLVSYVKRGGTLVLPCGQPFRYDVQPDGRGGFRKLPADRKWLEALHIDWTGTGKLTYCRTAPQFIGKFDCKPGPENVLLTGRSLKPGDRFIPMTEAGNDKLSGARSAIYRLDSDLKGNLIINLDWLPIPQSVTEETQAQFLPRAFLIAFSRGVERFFWYSLRSRGLKENDRESHFGICRSNLKPKPAYDAYRTLTRLCPSGSTVPRLSRKDGVWIADWKRPDGTGVLAVWTEFGSRKIRLHTAGKVSDAVDYLGKKLALPQDEFTATPGIVYFSGAGLTPE